MIDIYTLAPIETRSREHILPNALGGRLLSSELIDKTTNDRLGHQVDAHLVREFDHLRTVLNVRAGTGKTPPPFRRALGTDGERYRVLAGGAVELAHPIIRFRRNDDGTLRIEARAHKTEEIVTALSRAAPRYDFDLDEVLDRLEQQSFSPPDTRINVGFTDSAQRAVVKIACNTLAFFDRDLFTTPAFDTARSLVLGHCPLAAQVELVDPPHLLPDHPRSQELPNFDHLVLVEVTEDHTARACVSLFGSFHFAVTLAANVPAPACRYTYRVDPLERTHWVGSADDHAVKPEWHPRGGGSDVLECLTRSLKHAYGQTMYLQARDRTIQAAMNKLEEALAGREGQRLTPELWERVVASMAGAFIEEQHKIRGVLRQIRARRQADASETTMQGADRSGATGGADDS